MSGQSPEPSFPPSGQEGLTQGRPAWQVPPSYTPPSGSSAGVGVGTGGGQAYAAPPPTPYPPQDQGYPAHDQTQTGLGQDYQDYQGYQGYQGGYQAYGTPQGQAQGATAPPPQWHQAAGVKHVGGRPKSTDKGLIGSLFDFSFASMVTPKIIKALYVLFTIWTVLAAIGILIFFVDTGGAEGAVAAIVIDVVFILLSLGVYRIILEAFMVIFQIHGELKAIRAQGENES
jgi:Domain of unknown function (DUF4282)